MVVFLLFTQPRPGTAIQSNEMRRIQSLRAKSVAAIPVVSCIDITLMIVVQNLISLVAYFPVVNRRLVLYL